MNFNTLFIHADQMSQCQLRDIGHFYFFISLYVLLGGANRLYVRLA